MRPLHLLHPLWLGALALLAINDHLLKGSGLLPALLTGKLSDLAGLLVAPALLAVLARARSRRALALAHLAIAALFTAIQLSPACADALVAAMHALGRDWRIWSDPVDLVALVALWPSWRFCSAALDSDASTVRSGAVRRSAAWVATAVAAFFCMATSDVDPQPQPQNGDDVLDDADAPGRCGDGRLEGGEVCDDGNDEPEDGCTACQLDAPICLDGRRWLEWNCLQRGDTGVTQCDEQICEQLEASGSCAEPPLATVALELLGRWSAGERPPQVSFVPQRQQCGCVPGADGLDCAETCALVRSPCERITGALELEIRGPGAPDGVSWQVPGGCLGEPEPGRCAFVPDGSPIFGLLHAADGVDAAMLVPADDLRIEHAALQPDGTRVYLARYRGSVALGSVMLSASQHPGGLALFALDAQGAVRWARALGDPLVGELEVHGLAVDAETGALAVTARFAGRLRHGASELESAAETTTPVARQRFDLATVQASEASAVVLGFAADGSATWHLGLAELTAGDALRALALVRDDAGARWLVAATHFDDDSSRDLSELFALDDGGALQAQVLLGGAYGGSESLVVAGLASRGEQLVLGAMLTGRFGAPDAIVAPPDAAEAQDMRLLLELALDAAGVLETRWLEPVLPPSSSEPARSALDFDPRWPLVALGAGRAAALVEEAERSAFGAEPRLTQQALYVRGEAGLARVDAVARETAAWLAADADGAHVVLAASHRTAMGGAGATVSKLRAADGAVVWRERVGGAALAFEPWSSVEVSSLLLEPVTGAVVLGAAHDGRLLGEAVDVEGRGVVELWLAP